MLPRSLPYAAVLASTGCDGHTAALAAGSIAAVAGVGVYLARAGMRRRARADIGVGLRDEFTAGVSTTSTRSAPVMRWSPVLTVTARDLLSRFEKGERLGERERLIVAYALLHTESREGRLKSILAALLDGVDPSDLFLTMMGDADAARDFGSRNDCFWRLAKIAPHIGEERCARLAHKIASKLLALGGSELPQVLAEVASALPAGRVLDLMEEIADREENDVRILPKKALATRPSAYGKSASPNSALSRLFYGLSVDAYRICVPRMVKNLRHKNPARRCLAVACLGQAIRGMPREDRRAMSLILEKVLGDKNAGVRREAVEAVGKIYPGLRIEDGLRVVSSLQGRLNDPVKEVRLAAIDAIAAGADTLGDHSPKLGFIIAEFLFDEDAGIQAHAADALKNRVIPGLTTEGRIEYLRLMVERYNAEVPPDIIEEALVRVPQTALTKRAEVTGDEYLAKIAAYHALAISFKGQRLWKRYLSEKDPGAWLAETLRKLAAYRRGQPMIPPVTEEDMELAYLSLGAVKALPYSHIRGQIRLAPPPAPFLDAAFEGMVKEVREFRGKVDGGKLLQALGPIEDIASVRAFKDYLLEMIRDEKKRGAVRKIRAELEEVFSGDAKDARDTKTGMRARSRWKETLAKVEAAGEEEVLAAAGRLIPVIWKTGERPIKKRGGEAQVDGMRTQLSPPLQELLVRLVLLLAWHNASGTEIRRHLESVRAGGPVHADVMIRGLKSAEEFYRDRTEDVLKAHGIEGNQIPFIRKHRRLLAAEIERIEKVEMERLKVEFIPSCSQIDYFFNMVGEDCADPESVYRSDFQLYRMLKGNDLVGMLYLQKALLDGKKVLVLAIQPRASWQVDHAELLAVVRDGLSKIAGIKGYDYLLMMNAVNQQSNRQGMLKAIEAAKFRPISFDAKKTVSAARREQIIEERLGGAFGIVAGIPPPAHWYEVIQETVDGETRGVSGAVFSGANFLVLWERPASPGKMAGAPRKIPAAGPNDDDDELTECWQALARRAEEAVSGEKPAPAEGHVRILTAPVRYPAGTRSVVVQMDEDQSIPDAFAERLRVLFRERPDAPLAMRPFRPPSPAIAAEMAAAFAEAGIQMNPMGINAGMAEPADQMLLPTDALARAGRLVRYGQAVPQGALVLMHKHPLALFLNTSIVRADRGWIEPTLEGKEVVAVFSSTYFLLGSPHDWSAHSNVVTPQDLYDFYNIVFHQGLHFRVFLILLKNRGADVSRLGAVVEQLSGLLSWGLEHLLLQEFDQALYIFKEADKVVTEFRAVMNEIAATVGLEIDPVTGSVTELEFDSQAIP